MDPRSIFVVGLSCRFPESDSPYELFQNLLNKRDMVTADARRWKARIEDTPERFGKIKQDLNRFDYKFFTVHGKQAEKMEPQLRLLLEVSYEAFADAGWSLDEVKGTRTGVYIGSCSSDAHKAWLQNKETITGYEHTGCVNSMHSNRLSFFYDIHGPSETIDTACSSSLVAFHRAVADLESGACDHAIVGGSSIILWNHGSYAFHKLKMLSPDGACKSFDKSANGFARAEGVAALILTTQKKQKYRPYAKILGTGMNNGGWNPIGITFPSGEKQKMLYREVCRKAHLEPKELDYIEAHGTGTVAGDGEELGAIFEVYGKENPNLTIGSVKSNIGHCEGASGVAGLVKTLLCFDQEVLAPNLHLNDPNEKLKSMRVATEFVPSWKAARAAVSSFGFGGTNAHAILEKCTETPLQNAPEGFFLTLLAHRTKEGLAELKRCALPGLEIPNLGNKLKLPYRDALELPDDPEAGNVADSQDKIYFACSGNGSQWKGMGLKLISSFPAFKKTIDACGKALGIDLSALLQKGCNDALEATIGLVAIQIALVELLKTFGIGEEQIGGFFGHSAGEIVCSYLDKITSLEETMQIAHARGSVANKTGDLGQMASIGLSKEKMEAFLKEHKCEDKVFIACVNSPRNVTLSGYKEQVLAIVEKAEEKGIFNRVLDTYAKAYHSPLFAEHENELDAQLKKALGEKSIRRSEKWTTSVAEYQTDLFDHRYHVHGVLRPVDFIKAVSHLPQNAIVLEIGPHTVLKTLIKDNRPDVKYASLMKKDADEVETLKEGLGKLWKFGASLHFSREEKTGLQRPSLEVRSHLVSWDHSEELPIPKEEHFSGGASSAFKTVYDLSQEKDRYLAGHVIDGKILLPATSYLCAMWEAFRKKHDLQLSDPAVYCFEDFEILQAVQAEKDSKIELLIHNLDGEYQLKFKGEIVSRVKIQLLQNKVWEPLNARFGQEDKTIDRDHFYRIVGKAGYEYEDQFRVVQKIKSDFANNQNIAAVQFSQWIPFLDGLLQTQLLPPKKFLDELRVPVKIRSLIIQPSLLKEPGEKLAAADFDTGVVQGEGFELSHMETKELSRSSKGSERKVHIKQANSFLFYGFNPAMKESTAEYDLFLVNYGIKLCSQLIQENGLEGGGHYRKILEAFRRWDKAAPINESDAGLYRHRKEYIALRILEDCYRNNAKDFLEKPLASITQHEEYSRLYFEDPLGSLQDKTSLLKLLSIVRDNVDRFDLNILEIGTGTGGLTRLIAPYIIRDRYIATDITEALQMARGKETQHIDLSYKMFNLNHYEEYTLFKEQKVDLVLASNSLHTGKNIEKTLASIYSNLQEGAFILFYEYHTPVCLALWGMDEGTWGFEDEREYGLWITQESWLNKLKKAGFETISYVSDENQVSTLFLARKPLPLKLEVVEAPSIGHFDTWHSLIKDRTQPTLLVSEDLEHSGVPGFVRCLNREVEGSRYYCLLSDQKADPQTIAQVEKYGLKFNILQNGRLGTLCSADIQYDRMAGPDTGYYIQFPAVGEFGNYEWIANPPHQHIPCQVKYSSLNFKDVMLVSGKVSKDAFSGFASFGYIGLEFSGCDPKGNRYMGITAKGIATQVDTTTDLIIPIPDHLSYEDAATIPVVYGTAYYALFDRAKIEPGQSVLIHAGTGGVGQAAIRICLSLGCKIFVTCHQSKKGILKSLFPELEDAYILDSRTCEFERQVMKFTGGKGVHIVLNSLADDKLQASLRCVRREGHFLEIGKYDLMKHTALDMGLFLKNCSVHGVDLDQVFVQKEKVGRVTSQIAEGLRKGVVKPLPRHVFDHTQVEEAFRFMGAGKHIGKVLIDMQNFDQTTAKGRFRHPYYQDEKEEGFTLITGGLGGFGLALVQWLFKRGVRKFLLTSRKGVSTGEQERLIQILRGQGAEIIVSTHDVAKEKEAEELIGLARGRLKSIYHLAMVLEDTLFTNMTKEKWQAAVDVKAKGARNLDRLSRLPSVERFIVFSSMVTRFGNVGQSNYAFGNAIMEEICKRRKQDGYNALAIQWGVLENVGFVANNLEIQRKLKDVFHEAIKIDEALQFMDDVLAHNVNSHSVLYCTDQLKSFEGKETKLTFEEVVGQICGVIKMDLAKCNASDTLTALGIDSLQVVEIQTILIKSLQEVLPLKKIGGMKIGELTDLIKSRLGQTQEGVSETAKTATEEAPLLRKTAASGNKEALYYFLGYGVDSKSVEIPNHSARDVTFVNWQNATEIGQVAQAIAADAKERGYQKISFLTHSAGYHVAKAVMSLGTIKVERLIAISLLNESVIEKALNAANLENVPDEVFKAAYKNAAFYVEDHLPIDQIKRQSALLSKALKSKAIPPHLAIIPKDDTICEKPAGGVVIAGSHQAHSFDMKEIYALL